MIRTANFNKPLLVLISSCFLIFCAVDAHAVKKFFGMSVQENIKVGDTELVLNGAGLRKRLFLKLYVGALYLPQSSNDAAGIIAADSPMAIRIHVRSDLVTRKKLLAALKEGLVKATKGNTAHIKNEIDALIGYFKGQVKAGDYYTLAYEPGVGIHIMKAEEKLGVVEGLPFKQALFSVWLSDNSIQKSLRDAMLGG